MKSTRLKSSLNTQANDYFNRQRFHLTIKKNYKQMKSSMTQATDGGMIINHARFHMAT